MPVTKSPAAAHATRSWDRENAVWNLAGFLYCDSACGKRRGFSPGTAARHSYSPSARVHMDDYLFFVFFVLWSSNLFPQFSRNPSQHPVLSPDFRDSPVPTVPTTSSRSSQASRGNLGDDKIGCSTSKLWGILGKLGEKVGRLQKNKKLEKKSV